MSKTSKISRNKLKVAQKCYLLYKKSIKILLTSNVIKTIKGTFILYIPTTPMLDMENNVPTTGPRSHYNKVQQKLHRIGDEAWKCFAYDFT